MIELNAKDLAATISNDAESFLAVIDHVSEKDPEFPGFIIMLTGRLTDNIVTLLARENGETDIRISPQKALTSRYISSEVREPLGVLLRNKSIAGSGQRPDISVLKEHIRAFGKFTSWFSENSSTLSELRAQGRKTADLSGVCRALEKKAGLEIQPSLPAKTPSGDSDKLDRLIQAVEKNNELLSRILEKLSEN